MLDNSQTYIGVLAIFIVLCLFNDSENNKEKITVKVILYYLFFLKLVRKNYLY